METKNYLESSPIKKMIHVAHLFKFAHMQALNEEKLNFQQGCIIRYLLNKKDKETSQKELSEILNVKQSSVTSMLNTMEKSGLIERKTGKDARERIIKLTDKAINFSKRFDKSAKEMEEMLLKGLSENEKKEFFDILLKMEKNLKEINLNV